MNNFDNLLIMKTMSKVGLAGLRLGYLFGETSIIKQINKLRLPFNINSFSQKISELYTGDNDFIDAQTKELVWQGKVSGYISTDPQRKTEHIFNFVNEILNQYPPEIR